jgi:small subunit ribosomal protein S21
METFGFIIDTKNKINMLIINVKDGGSIDQALKTLKNKVFKTKLIRELRERQTYEKPSVQRRKEILNATRSEKINKERNN